MRSTPDTPVDSFGTLGAPIRPEPDKPVDTAKPFETGNYHRDGSLIGNQNEAVKSIVDTLRKKSAKDEACELPRIRWAWTRINRKSSSNDWADRWHFEGGAEEGYESLEAAEDARAELNPIFAFYIGGIAQPLDTMTSLNQWIETEMKKICGIPAPDVRLIDGEEA